MKNGQRSLDLAASAPEPWPRSHRVGRPQPSGRRTHPWAIATFDREPDAKFSCAHAAAEGAGGVCWVTGEIDLAKADAFRVRAVEALETYGPPLTIDMSGVRFMDSSGPKALVDIRAHARRAGHLPQIRLRGLSGHVARVLEITGVATLFARC